MRVVLLIASLDRGGAENQTILLAAGLRSRGHDVVIACLKAPGALLGYARNLGVPVIDLGMNGNRNVLSEGLCALWRIKRLLKEDRQSILYSMLPAANVAAATVRLLGWRGPIAWGVRSADMPLSRYGAKTRLVYALQKPLSPACNAMICNSECGRRHYVSLGYAEKRIRVIPNGFDAEHFKPDPVARERMRAQLGMTPENLAIGIAARLDPVKDHHTFLKAARSLFAQHPQARFLIAGAGPNAYRAELAALADGYGIGEAVMWLGAVKDMHGFYNALDVSTLCSVSEGLPNAIGEAMACGIPCASTDAGDAAVLIDDPSLIAPKRSADDLARIWLSLSSGEHRRFLGARARQRILDRYSVSAMIDGSEAALMELLAHGSFAPNPPDGDIRNLSTSD